MLMLSESQVEFRRRLYNEWLPAFCKDERRQYPLDGFRDDSITVSDFDAANFLTAFEKGLVRDQGGGRYLCAQSKAQEQLFWEGSRAKSPRPITLWLEPIITIATAARLRFSFGWPEELIGMQSKDWAFDFAAFRPGDLENEHIAGEVKKSAREIDLLLEDILGFCDSQIVECPSDKPHVVNSFKKWVAIRERKPTLFWAVGPDDYTKVFRVSLSKNGFVQLAEAGLEQLHFE